MGHLVTAKICTALLTFVAAYIIFSHVVIDNNLYITNCHKHVLHCHALTDAKKTEIIFFSDLIGVVTHIRPHDLARKISKTKLHKVLIQDLRVST
jgi:hypothetical protein